MTKKVSREDLTQEMALEHLRYEPSTGIFVWAKSPSLSISAGAVAGALTRKGYLTIRLFDTPYQAHRLAWFMIFGKWPDQIDHINGDRADNRLCNLREVTNGQNQLNRPSRGYTRNGRYGFMARTTVDGVRIYLGTFDTEQQANEAYLRAHARLHGEHSFTNRSSLAPKEGSVS